MSKACVEAALAMRALGFQNPGASPINRGHNLEGDGLVTRSLNWEMCTNCSNLRILSSLVTVTHFVEPRLF